MLKLRFLGPPHIEVDGVDVEIQRHKAISLLAYLAITGEMQQRDTLVTLFWPDSPQSRARASLRRDLSELNKALGGDWLMIGREKVGLQTEGLWLDVTHFQALLAGCEQKGRADDAACADCLPKLTEAVKLYRDDFLAGFTLSDCPDFDDWQFFQSEALRQALSSALERLVQCYTAAGEFDSALPHARRWLVLDSLHEPAHRQLMQLYAQTGQKAAALRQYQTSVSLLAEELGIAPSDETTALYEHIRISDAGGEQAGWLDESKLALPAKPDVIPTNNLPAPTTPFVGRVQALAEITRSLGAQGCRLLTLIGPGGIGKTRLAIAAAQNLVVDAAGRAHFADGIYFVRLISLNSTDQLVPTIADTLDLHLAPDLAPKEQLLGALRNRTVLLVLDNFEHLLEMEGDPTAANIVADILSAAPGVVVLATSREALNVQGECLYPVEGMRYPTETTAVDIETYSAVQLFTQSARRVRPDFDLAAESDCVLRICRLVEGMPLAIELAAAWLKVLHCDEIASELERSLDLLTTSLRNVPDRHRSIRAVFEHSWQLLSPSEQAILCKLAVFRGGFNQEEAREVAGATLSDLAALVEKSMLKVTPGGLYRMHGMLRQFAVEKHA